MLAHGCDKGSGLVDDLSVTPTIMNTFPFENPALLSVSREYDGDAVKSGAELPAGVPVTLKYNGTFSIHGTHVAFIVSSGELPNSEVCGDKGAKLICTTCGNAGFIKYTTWTPGP